MSKVTKAQLSELETLLEALKAYMDDRGAPRSLIANIEDVAKSINWVKQLKSQKP